MFKEQFDNVRRTRPLVHCITNYVTVNDVANAVLAVGASPIMADDEGEAADITSLCPALCVNIGTLNQRTIRSMLIAAAKAYQLGHKTVLDPVGAGASRLRTGTALRLLDATPFSVVRGNISEIKSLAIGHGGAKGVDANECDAVTEENLDAAVCFAKSFAKRLGSVVAITGAIDIAADSGRAFVIRNGRAQMASVTGTGCMLSAVTAAFVASGGDTLEAAAAAVSAMGLAGEVAWSRMQKGDGNAAYRCRIIDALYNMTGKELETGAKYDIM